MPGHKSAIKHMRHDEKRRVRNKSMRSAVKTAAKKIRQTVKRDEALRSLPEAESTIDRAARRNAIHWRTAARLKSRLAKHANKAQA